jgi:AcrR family transcriptional regulator
MTAREDRRLRADAERNRRRLLEAATDVFREHGLEAGVAEIAQRAGVGRGTLFRNFSCKEDLIAAIVVDQISDVVARGRELLERPDAGAALFELLEEIVGRQRLNRALFEAFEDTFLANQEIRAAHAELLAVLEELLAGAKRAGAVRQDVGTGDLLMLVKGVCQVGGALCHGDPSVIARQLDLVRCALSTAAAEHPLRGRALSLADIAPPPTGRLDNDKNADQRGGARPPIDVRSVSRP